MGDTSSFLPFKTGNFILNKSHTKKRFDKGGKESCTVKEPMALSAFLIIIRKICWLFSLIARISLVTLLPKLVNKLFSLHGTWIFFTVYTRTIHWTILCQVSHALLFKIRFNIITKYKPRSLRNISYFRAKTLYSVYLSAHACYMTRTPTPSWYRRENIRCTVQIMKLRIFFVLFSLPVFHELIFWKLETNHQVHIKPQLKLETYILHFWTFKILKRLRIDDNFEPKHGKNSPYLIYI